MVRIRLRDGRAPQESPGVVENSCTHQSRDVVRGHVAQGRTLCSICGEVPRLCLHRALETRSTLEDRNKWQGH